MSKTKKAAGKAAKKAAKAAAKNVTVLFNAVKDPAEANELLATARFCHRTLARYCEERRCSAIVRNETGLGWIMGAIDYIESRLGKEIVRQHVDGPGVTAYSGADWVRAAMRG